MAIIQKEAGTKTIHAYTVYTVFGGALRMHHPFITDCCRGTLVAVDSLIW